MPKPDEAEPKAVDELTPGHLVRKPRNRDGQDTESSWAGVEGMRQ